jgi:hypothetical protein
MDRRPIDISWKTLELLASWVEVNLPKQLELGSENPSPPQPAALHPSVEDDEHPQADRRRRDQRAADRYYQKYIAGTPTPEDPLWFVLWGPRGLLRGGRHS